MSSNFSKNKTYKSITERLHMKIISSEEEISELKKSPIQEKCICYKILIIGADLVGKTSFCNRISRNSFDLEIKSSIETTCFLKTVCLFDEEIKLFLLDVKANSMDEEEEKELYKDIDGIIAIYDITQYDSLEKTEKILNATKKKCKWNNNIPIYMLGNKNDLKFLRAIDFEESINKVSIKGYEIKEINCIKNDDIAHNVIKNLVARIYFNNLNNEEKDKIRNEAKNFELEKE
jgi:small GTP-binding protein